MTTALIMAGGRGERLRASGNLLPKPLVPIAGVALLERNLVTLLSAGFNDIVVAVPSHTPEIAEFVRTRCRMLVDTCESQLRLFEESSPLGNIGAAAEITPCDAELLVVYADNLTLLDLNALVAHHVTQGAALTSAVHWEPFRMPYGEVDLEEGCIVAYREKPERRTLISSGVFVLNTTAISLLPRARHSDVAWLVNRLLDAQHPVAAYLHEAPWIDVNDAAAVLRAEQLVRAHPAGFAVGEGLLERRS